MRQSLLARLWVVALLLVPACARGPLLECEKLEPESARSQCYSRAASRARDAKLCTALKSAFAQARCLESVASRSQLEKLCTAAEALIPSPDCFDELARNENNPALCSRISSPFLHQRCLSGLLAVRFRGPEVCEQMSLPGQRDACLTRLVENDPTRVELCAKADRSGACYRAAAIRDAPALCERVGSGPDARTRRACYEDALGQARAGRQIKARQLVAADCASIPNSTQYERCWTLLALARHDASHCTSLSAGDAADDCWFNAAALDADHCLHIDSSVRRADCALKYWPTSSASAVCAELAPDELKRACIHRAETNKPAR